MNVNTKTSAKVSDLDLINQFKKGSDKAFEALILRHESKMYSIALRYTRNAEDAEEVIQETCLKLFSKLKTFEGKSAFTSWLYRVVVNHSLMHLRKKRQEKATLFEDLSFYTKNQCFERASEDLLQADSRSIQHETREALETAINKLADEYKTVFIMRDVDGLNNEEVSQILKISVPAVKSRLHRARLMLQKRLDRYWNDYSGVQPMVDLTKTVQQKVVNG